MEESNTGINDKKNKFDKIRSKYIVKQIFDNLSQKKVLKLLLYNKALQNRINIGISDYKYYYEKIEIEIIPIDIRLKNKFINIPKNEENFYHIFINNNYKETKKNFFEKGEEVTKIKIVIDNNIKSLKGLFSFCVCIEKINFIKFNINDIVDMSYMFRYCISLKELILNNFNTENVTNMEAMFFRCTSLNEMDLNKFNTNKVINMKEMFAFCPSLAKLNFDNFVKNKDTDKSDMFFHCS